MNALEAIEVRARWLEWAKKQGPGAWNKIANNDARRQRDYANAIVSYTAALETGETFYMDQHFGDLVGHAAHNAPDDLAFDPKWMLRPHGFLYLAEPFPVPKIQHIPGRAAGAADHLMIRVRAIAWRRIGPGDTVVHHGVKSPAPDDDSYHFMTYQSFSDYGAARWRDGTAGPGSDGFGCWSFFILRPGQQLGERIEQYETALAKYDPDAAYERQAYSYHEIRWIYTAMHLMSQRLATTVKQNAPRQMRRRLEREGSPAVPFVQIVTLRRLEQERPKPDAPEAREWHWQWSVRGHWRQQWYPAEGVHKPKFIEAYIKGDPSKPFKEMGAKLFIAKR